MKVAIVADTHWAVDRFQRLLQNLKAYNIRHLIHAGDYDGMGIEEILRAEKSFHFYIALGNCDRNSQKNSLLQEQSHITLEHLLSFSLEGINFGVAHIPGEAQRMLRDGRIRVYVNGHTHRRQIKRYSGGMVLNPGSLMDSGGCLLLELPSLEVADYTVD